MHEAICYRYLKQKLLRNPHEQFRLTAKDCYVVAMDLPLSRLLGRLRWKNCFWCCLFLLINCGLVSYANGKGKKNVLQQQEHESNHREIDDGEEEEEEDDEEGEEETSWSFANILDRYFVRKVTRMIHLRVSTSQLIKFSLQSLW